MHCRSLCSFVIFDINFSLFILKRSATLSYISNYSVDLGNSTSFASCSWAYFSLLSSKMTEENRQESIMKMFEDLEKRTGSVDGYFSFLENCGNYTNGGTIDESTVKKKMRRNEGIEEEEGVLALKSRSQDPLAVLGLDIMYLILSCLDATGVAPCLLVSRAWNGVSSSDRLWSSMCDQLWRGKAHIPRIARLPGLPKLAAYSLSAIDGKRTRITRVDLCDHVWEFRFNKEAPEYWKKLDPSWEEGADNGHRRRRPMSRYFHQDGSQTAGPGDEVWGGHEASYCTVTGMTTDGKIRAHYVRINRWPPLSLSRKDDWTWEMSSSLVRYTSVPDSDKEDGTGPLFVGF